MGLAVLVSLAGLFFPEATEAKGLDENRSSRGAASGGLGIAGGALVPGSGPALSTRLSWAQRERISVGLLGAFSLHSAPGDATRIGHGALEMTWRLDRGAVVPSLHLGAGGLVRRRGAASDAQAVVHMGAAADWWPGGPYRGLSFGAELRYLGSPTSGQSPIMQLLAFRIGWGF